MAFWGDLSKKASETTSKAVQKAKDMSDISKLNSMISEEERKINNCYYEIGKLYVSLHFTNYENEFSGIINAINDSNSKIENYKKQIQEIKGIQICRVCGAEIPAGVSFCSSCGYKIEYIQQPVNNDFNTCPNCGMSVQKELQYCTECGTQMYASDTSKDSVGNENQTCNTQTNDNFEENQISVCPSCGSNIRANAAFCTKCGAKVK